ncbi:hypothetical protein GCM10027073_17380 [Streptomyces chlorus]
MVVMREAYDGYPAASRLKVPAAAWRWWRPRTWSRPPMPKWVYGRAVVEATDAEALRRPAVSL